MIFRDNQVDLAARTRGTGDVKSAGQPGVGCSDHSPDVRWQSTGQHLLEGRLIENLAQRGPDRNPHLGQVRGNARVRRLMRSQSANLSQRTVYRADYRSERDLARGQREGVAAVGASLTAHQSRSPQFTQDSLDELSRQLLFRNDRIDLDQAGLPSRELQQRSHRVIRLGGYIHVGIFANPSEFEEIFEVRRASRSGEGGSVLSRPEPHGVARAQRQ